MSLLVALTIGLVWWVSAWSLGIKSFDAFMVTMLIVVLAATWYVAKPFVQSFLGRGGPGEQPG
jgi:Mn2+/Fe2+ NRAMP family transporter